jgi:hypothetical protein
MSLVSKKAVLAVKTETSIGTAIALANADAAFHAFDVSIQPTAEIIARPALGAMGNFSSELGAKTGTVSFRTELYATSNATPAFLATLLPACGFVAGITQETANTYLPVSAAPGGSVKTVTIGVYRDGMLKRLRGSVGNAEFVYQTGNPVAINWTFAGAWVTPTDAAILTPTYPSPELMRADSAALTIGSYTPCFSSMTLNMNNVLTPRFCVTAEGGIHSFMITDRAPGGTLDPETKLVATEPSYTNWINKVERAMTLELAAGTANCVFTAPKFQITNAQEGDREGLVIDTLTYQLNRDDGDDELQIAFGEV